MSITLNRSASLEPVESTLLDGTGAITIHTASTAYARVVEVIALANIDASNACIVTLHTVDATPTSRVFWSGEVPAKSTVIIDTLKVTTQGNGKVRSITATAANANDIWVTVITSAQGKQGAL